LIKILILTLGLLLKFLKLDEDYPPPSKSGATLNATAGQGAVARIGLLIERENKLENSVALHFPPKYSEDDAKSISILQCLLELVVDINRTNDDLVQGQTPTRLHWVVSVGKFGTAQFLLEDRVDPHKLSYLGRIFKW
jgi:hypothetical protein